MNGKFISFEGPDGAGKTSVIQQIQRELEDQLGTEKVMYTREPGGNKISEQIRKVLFDGQNTDMDGRTEALLFAAARRQHIVSEIIPGLKAGKVILCDRFVDSSIAYQGAGRGLGEKEIWQINQFAIDGHMPDKTIFLDVDPKIGLSRLASRSFKDRLDQESIQFHNDTFNGYKQIVEKFKDRMIIINANNSESEVIEEAYRAIKGLIND